MISVLTLVKKKKKKKAIKNFPLSFLILSSILRLTGDCYFKRKKQVNLTSGHQYHSKFPINWVF